MYIVNLVQVVIIRLPALTLSAESFSLNFVKNRKLSSWVLSRGTKFVQNNTDLLCISSVVLHSVSTDRKINRYLSAATAA